MVGKTTCLTRFEGVVNATLPLSEFAKLALEHPRKDSIDFQISGTRPWWSLSRIMPAALHDWDGRFGVWEIASKQIRQRTCDLPTISDLLTSGQLTFETEIRVHNGEWNPIAYYLASRQDDVSLAPLVNPTTGPLDVPQNTINEHAAHLQFNRVVSNSAHVGKICGQQLVCAVAMLLSLCVLAYFLMQPNEPDELEIRAFRLFRATLDGLRAMRNAKPSPEEWAMFGEELKRDLEPYREALSSADARNSDAKEALFWTIEYRLPVILRDGRFHVTRAELGMELDLKQVGQLIGSKEKP